MAKVFGLCCCQKCVCQDDDFIMVWRCRCILFRELNINALIFGVCNIQKPKIIGKLTLSKWQKQDASPRPMESHSFGNNCQNEPGKLTKEVVAAANILSCKLSDSCKQRNCSKRADWMNVVSWYCHNSLYPSSIPIVLHDPHACFLALFLWFEERLVAVPSTTRSVAFFTFRVKLDSTLWYMFNLVDGSDIKKSEQ